ncbi:MAG: hypothetical protein Kow0083_06410 [Methylophaga sp.]|jgi:hypothetical protein
MPDNKQSQPTSNQVFIDNNKGLQPTSSGTPMPKVKPAKTTGQTQQSTTTAKKNG